MRAGSLGGGSGAARARSAAAAAAAAARGMMEDFGGLAMACTRRDGCPCAVGPDQTFLWNFLCLIIPISDFRSFQPTSIVRRDSMSEQTENRRYK
jgi:hypothetical protein